MISEKNVVECKSTNSDLNRQGKRRIANKDACEFDLKDEISILKRVFQEAARKTNILLNEISPEGRNKNLRSNVMQSCFAEALIREFGEKARYGKYGRLMLSVKGYLILFKKLSKYGTPMNAWTKNVQRISDQQQLDLFSTSNYYDPILFFGYQEDKLGVYGNPQINYIDEGILKFSINLLENGDTVMTEEGIQPIETSVGPRLKDKLGNVKIS